MWNIHGVLRCAVILATCASAAVANSPNLLVDPGSEDVSLENWEASGVAAVLGEQGHTGWNSLRLNVPWSSDADRHQWSQTVTEFTGDVTEIFLGAWFRVTLGDAKYPLQDQGLRQSRGRPLVLVGAARGGGRRL